MNEPLTIGILGGMGPEATNRLCARITAATPARRDQDHVPVITYNNPRIPDRVRGVYGGGESPVPELVRTARVLEDAGADVLVMPCNLAHFFIAEIQSGVRVPVLDIIEETVRFVVDSHPLCRAAGLLASTPTIRCRLFDAPFRRHGVEVVVPDCEEQETKVMRAIYGPEGIKSGRKEGPRALLRDAAQGLAAAGACVVIAGCTEIPLVLSQADVSVPVVDPLEVIAGVAVRLALSGVMPGGAGEVEGIEVKSTTGEDHGDG
jgi:aspartate racemase